MDEAIGREVDVRFRHARLARSLQQAALERLVAIRPGELSVKLAVEMLRIGIDAERVALGLGDVVPKLARKRSGGGSKLYSRPPCPAADGADIAPAYEKGVHNITTPPSSPAH